jgi:hypothetical protein
MQIPTMEIRHHVSYACVISKHDRSSEFFHAHMNFMQNVLINGWRWVYADYSYVLITLISSITDLTTKILVLKHVTLLRILHGDET